MVLAVSGRGEPAVPLHTTPPQWVPAPHLPAYTHCSNITKTLLGLNKHDRAAALKHPKPTHVWSGEKASFSLWSSCNRTLKSFTDHIISATEWAPAYIYAKSSDTHSLLHKGFYNPNKETEGSSSGPNTKPANSRGSLGTLWSGSREQSQITPVGVTLRYILNSFQFTHSTTALRAQGVIGMWHNSRYKENGRKSNSTTLISRGPHCSY